MELISNQVLAIAFFLLAAALTFLMFHLWGFPYDKDKHRSSAPRSLVILHRLLGYAFLAIYLLLMWDMVPRLWTYQVELPARTVAHLVLGMAIGAMLFTKIAIVRFFKHLEAKLVPLLGTGLFICTALLLGLALPVGLREAYLRDAAQMGDAFSAERLERVRTHLPQAGLDDPEQLAALATTEGLLAGRAVLVNKCVQCHDLRTVLARPKTPDGWRQTVARMANRSTVLEGIGEAEQWQVTAYLVAISPTLQRSARLRRMQDLEAARSQQAAMGAMTSMASEVTDFDAAAAREVFLARCSLCHAPQMVDASPPANADAVKSLVTRMVRNGLRASDEDLAQIVRYLTVTYTGESGSAAGGPARTNRMPATPGAQLTNPDADNGTSKQADARATGGTTFVRKTARLAREDVVETVLIVTPAGESLAFEQPRLTARVGANALLTLDNSRVSAHQHNLVLLERDASFDEVALAALEGADRGFLPDHPGVIAAIPMTPSGASGAVSLALPSEPGDYPFFCMMPGHGQTMRGTLTLER